MNLSAIQQDLWIEECETVTAHSLRAWCTVRSKYRNVRVWSRERFVSGPGKETGGTCLKKAPKPLKAFSEALALGG